NVDHTAAAGGFQRLKKTLASAQRAVQVYIHETVPFALADRYSGFAECLTGGVKQDIDPVKFMKDGITQFIDRVPAGRVSGPAKGPAPQLLDFRCYFTDEIFTAAGGNYVRSGLRQPNCKRSADAGCSTHNHCNSSGKIEETR